jgi:hypothetical protein
MDPSVIPALAALMGAVIGALTSGTATWLAHRTQARAQLLAQEKLSRHELYRDFIDEAAKCYVDALQRGEADLPALVGVYAKISRMRILSSPRVVESAEQIGRKIVDTYAEPDKTFVELREMIDSGSIDVLREFAETCCSEFETLRVQHF